MNYLLDTNICIHFFRGRFNLIHKLEEVGVNNCAISEITLAELVFGAENSSNPKKNHDLIEEFINQITILPVFNTIYKYGKEKAKLRKSGNMISDFDLLIGCTATENDLLMVTENTREFERIDGIKLKNWIIINLAPIYRYNKLFSVPLWYGKNGFQKVIKSRTVWLPPTSDELDKIREKEKRSCGHLWSKTQYDQ